MNNTDAATAAVWKALRQVLDPELGMDIVTLGLVFDVALEDDTVHVTHTLTSPGCPMGPIIDRGIHDVLSAVPGIARVETHLVWHPSWHPGMIAPGAVA